jgi:hypothetical protein
MTIPFSNTPQLPLDVALVDSATSPGRLTFQWDKSGDLVFDNSQAYAVLVTVCSNKGRYRPDRNFGTLLYTIVHDTSATGSQLSAAGNDGLQQAAQGNLIQNYSCNAQRTRPGAWNLAVNWQINGTQDVSRTLRF